MLAKSVWIVSVKPFSVGIWAFADSKDTLCESDPIDLMIQKFCR
jgi:hypothetical protein